MHDDVIINVQETPTYMNNTSTYIHYKMNYKPKPLSCHHTQKKTSRRQSKCVKPQEFLYKLRLRRSLAGDWKMPINDLCLRVTYVRYLSNNLQVNSDSKTCRKS